MRHLWAYHAGRACIGRKPWYAKKKDVQLDAPTYHRMAMVMITTVKAEMVRLACHMRPLRIAVPSQSADVCTVQRLVSVMKNGVQFRHENKLQHYA